METWQIIVSIGGLATPIVLAVMARDRSMLGMINGTKADVAGAKEDMAKQVKAAIDPVHERINRIRDEFVRRDDLEGHLTRWEKQFDDLRAEMRRNNEKVDGRLSEIVDMLRVRRAP